MIQGNNRYVNSLRYRSSKNYGYGVFRPHQRTLRIVNIQDVLGLSLSNITERIDTLLTPFNLYPDWSWGWQGTGDCTSWSAKVRLETRLAILVAAGLIQPPPYYVRQESIYAFSRVEIYGRPDRGGPGSYDGAVVTALKKFGHLYSESYPEADLTEYSGSRAISWGRTGVPDDLEKYAIKHVIKDYAKVTDLTTAGLLIQSGYPLAHCDASAVWGTKRGDDGVAIRFDSAAHSMASTGVRWDRNGEVEAIWVCNSGHGPHVTGPIGPIEMPEVYAACGSWVPARYIYKALANGDCHVFDFIEGWPLLKPSDYGYSEVFTNVQEATKHDPKNNDTDPRITDFPFGYNIPSGGVHITDRVLLDGSHDPQGEATDGDPEATDRGPEAN